jgi:hypothetical protein
MQSVGVIVDGVWMSVIDDAHREVIDPSMHPVDQIVAHLGRVVALAQNLSEQDARRARDFVAACSSTLAATTYLPRADQEAIQSALRDARK